MPGPASRHGVENDAVVCWARGSAEKFARHAKVAESGRLQGALDLFSRIEIDVDRVDRLLDRGTIEIAPLAFMRGRTLTDAFVILDEAQNTTSEQMKMFLTRLGFGSKAVITGDITQIDLPIGRASGLVEAQRVIEQVDGVSFTRFGDCDVVRHPLVRRIVRAYEAHTSDDSRGGSTPAVLPTVP